MAKACELMTVGRERGSFRASATSAGELEMGASGAGLAEEAAFS